ncbi:hypothetical protein [Afipia felis]|uniref:Terminase n=3 Tax=Afipia felis TaxID=1035 RepID=A0A380W807_AFIFE|nr:hypothetical protein [Afipia felis]EKS26506.1 hypothetical protein HMPREF9697_04041 [Afipia felis ATCC 53690]SUU76160.1 Uncharacterised protein [Afipia felis]SUU84227.1 Uncharacterised protein [Afipia felis]
MTTPAVNFGNDMNSALAQNAGHDVLTSAGPISDDYMLSTADVSVIEGPQGSAKTTSSFKKMLVEAQRIYPGADGVRRYELGVFREKYDNLWKATIPSYFTVIPKNFPGSEWTGASPRAAKHVVRFDDGFGRIELTVHFLAFGESASPEDLRGLQFTDVYLNEIDTMPENLFTYLVGRVGRSPPRAVIRRGGRIYGDMNAPDVLSWTYRDLHEDPKEGYKLFRQPGGRDPGAENLKAMGREYYDYQARINAHRPWWVRRMVDNLPGFSRDMDLVYSRFDDQRMVSPMPLQVFPYLPVLVGVDGGLTPAAWYAQETNDGQLRILAEICLERGGMKELAEEMLVLEGRRFAGCEFATVCDPAMGNGETDDVGEVSEGSERLRLSKHLGRKVVCAKVSNQDIDARCEVIRDKISLNLEGGRPGYILDPSCKALRRGKNQTYHFRRLQGTNDRASIAKTPDSHIGDAEQYGSTLCGTAAAKTRQREDRQRRERRREEARNAGRYNPHKRGRG